jgi:hypothetical protein
VQGHWREASCLNDSVPGRNSPERVTPSSYNMQLLDLALSVHLSFVLSPALLLSEIKRSAFALYQLPSQVSITAHSFWLRCDFCGQNVSQKLSTDILQTPLSLWNALSSKLDVSMLPCPESNLACSFEDALSRNLVDQDGSFVTSPYFLDFIQNFLEHD